MEIQNKQNHMENKQPLQICSSLPVYQNSVDKAVNERNGLFFFCSVKKFDSCFFVAKSGT